MKRALTAFAAGLVLATSATSAEATELRMLGGFAENFVFTTEIAVPFMKLVEEESGGALTVSLQGPEVVPTFEQLEPVQAGVYDLLFTHPAYHVGVTSVGLMIDAIAADPQKRRDGGVFDYIDQHYQTHGLKLIALPPAGSDGFRYYLKDPITATPGLQGRKVRGTQLYQRMIEALGGSAVVLPGGEVYSALQNGVVDGAIWSLTGAKDFKWYEVSGYMADPTFGQASLIIFMNLDAWNALGDEEREVIERAAKRLELESVARFDKLIAEEKEALLGLGMKMTSFSEEEARDLDRLFADGVWALGMEKNPQPVGELRAVVDGAGLAN